MATVNTNPILGSDIDLLITLQYNNGFITSGVTFDVVYFDSYNHGKVWKLSLSGVCEENHWKVRFPAEKQKYAGYYTVVCTCPLSNEEESNIQKVTFRNAFFLENSLLPPSHVDISLIAEVESTVPTLIGTLSVGLIVKDTSYNPQTMIIHIDFVGGTSCDIDAREIFPFRVLSSADFENMTQAQILANVFYYVYESDEVTESSATELEDGTWRIILNSRCEDVELISGVDYRFNLQSTAESLGSDGNYTIHLSGLL